MTVRVRAAVLTNFQQVALDHGLNPQAALSDAGLSASMLQDPEYLIPLGAVLQLLENAAQSSACPTFGLRMALSRQFAHLGAVSLVLNYQPTLRDSLNMLIQYRHLMHNSLAYFMEDQEDLTIFGVQVSAGAAGPTRQANELAVGVTARLCAHLLGGAWKPVAVYFSHAAPPDRRDYVRVFGCPVVFDARFNGIACRSDTLDAANAHADALLARHASRFLDAIGGAETVSLGQEVRSAICVLLPRRRATIEQVAAAMGVTVRTLQRKLTVERCSFSDLVNEVRRDVAQRYLRDPAIPVAEVSELTGYSVHSSFTRWFIQQFDQTPQAWRGQS